MFELIACLSLQGPGNPSRDLLPPGRLGMPIAFIHVGDTMERTRNVKQEKGFSLIEMTWVMIIFGIVVALAAPSFSRYLETSRLQGASSELIADIHYAGSLALARHRTYSIQFQPGQYSVIETATGAVIRTRTAPIGFAFAASANPSFYAWGLTDAANITISNGSRVANLALSSTGTVLCN
jgi:prepilin-type N-terminal cleavage/methylation domain-containing protein